ncbi:hypothetical protein ABK040_002265 [Willaertia magna]
MKRKDIAVNDNNSDTTKISTKKVKHETFVKTQFSSLPAEILTQILNFTSFNNEEEETHPFAFISKATRNCWLKHYLSLPRIKEELSNFGNSDTFPLKYKLNFLKEVIALIVKEEIEPLEKEDKKLNQLNEGQVNKDKIIDRLRKLKELNNKELKEMENIIKNYCVNIKIICKSHYEGDTLSYFLYKLSFEICKVKFCSTCVKECDGMGPEGETEMPDEEDDAWMKIISKSKCSLLTSERLYEIMNLLLDIDDKTFEYKTIYSVSKAQEFDY